MFGAPENKTTRLLKIKSELYDAQVEDGADPTAALEEVLQSPDKLRDLDLDAFAEELQRQVKRTMEQGLNKIGPRNVSKSRVSWKRIEEKLKRMRREVGEK